MAACTLGGHTGGSTIAVKLEKKKVGWFIEDEVSWEHGGSDLSWVGTGTAGLTY
jgi:hypothetical protein